MAKKITLTVNETLFDKIDQWRSSFNLSKVFQDAVSEAIKAKEEFHRRLSGKEDIPQIVERLKAEKRGCLGKACSDGESDGGSWAGRAHYRELVSVLAWMNEETNGQSTAKAMPAAKNTPAPEDQCFEVWQKRANLPDTGSPELADLEQAYREGWRTGVRGLWEIIKDQLDD
jgi:hypothetical protein